uniref:CWH43-like N-terminal domain-containing protein n=1 Tax=Hyaloperonospora arabidopsidis (strain Emoy2) TaxID=559515 RepID=M4BDW7_HYAAE
MVTCVIIVKVNHIWVNYPACYVFATGLTIVSVLLVITWTLNWRYHMSALSPDDAVFRAISFVAFVAGVMANPGLPILAYFDTSKHSKLHAAGAEWFFYIETIAVLLNTIVSYKLYKMLTGLRMDLENSCSTVGSKLQRRRKTLAIQVLFFSLFFVAFLLYMPIGTAMAPKPFRLSIDDCIDRGLGETYCGMTMRLNSTSTTLYDDVKTYGTSQMRAAAQLACILTLVGYSTSFITNDYDDSIGQIFTPDAKIAVLQ